MGIFSFLGFYYSLAQARISHALENDSRGTKRKYTLVKLLWIGLMVLAFYIKSNLLGFLLIFLAIVAIPLALSIAGNGTSKISMTRVHPDDESERWRRRRILKQIDTRESRQEENE